MATDDALCSDDVEKPKDPRLANLKPFVAGKSGNPKGKVPGTLNRSTIVKKWLESQIKNDDGVEMPAYDHITLAAITRAMKGDVAAFTALLDNAYGKLTDKQELTGANGEPLTSIVRTVVDPKADKA